jgi:hypothetical protein
VNRDPGQVRRNDETRLQQYLVRNGIPSARVEAKLRERLEGRAPSRKQMARWRQRKAEIRRKDMVRLLWAVRAVSHNPDLRIEELFELDPESDEIWRD